MDQFIFERIRLAMDIDTKNSIEMALKTSEETGELAEAVLSTTCAPGNAYKKKTSDDVLEEAADVMICALATAFRVVDGLYRQQLLDMLNRKIDKWEKKCRENPRARAFEEVEAQ
jgi:NTP pyrophosphatase (non-canonical NTP hydrolase)